MLNINFSNLKMNRKMYNQMVVEVDSTDYGKTLDDLLHDVRYELGKRVSVYGNPKLISQSEKLKSSFVETILCNSLHFAKKVNNVNHYVHYIELLPEFSIPREEPEDSSGMEYSVVLQHPQIGTRRKRIIVIEVKKGDVFDALPQCFLAMHHLYKGKEVLAFATNASQWILCSYSGGTNYQISFSIDAFIKPSNINQSDIWEGDSLKGLAKLLLCIFDLGIKNLTTGADEPDEAGEVEEVGEPANEESTVKLEERMKDVQKWIDDSIAKEAERDLKL